MTSEEYRLNTLLDRLSGSLSDEEREAAIVALLRYKEALRDVPVEELIEEHRFTLEDYKRMSKITLRHMEERIRKGIANVHRGYRGRNGKKVYGGTRVPKARKKAKEARKYKRQRKLPNHRWRRLGQKARTQEVEFLISKDDFLAWFETIKLDKKGRHILEDYYRTRFRRKDASLPYTIDNLLVEGMPRTCKYKKWVFLADGAEWKRNK